MSQGPRGGDSVGPGPWGGPAGGGASRPCQSGSGASWDGLLDTMEDHLAAIVNGLERPGAGPGPYETAPPAEPLPARLAGRARAVLAAQRDVEEVLRWRLGVLGLAIHGDVPGAGSKPEAFYVDRRA